jgi:hypothetical protein
MPICSGKPNLPPPCLLRVVPRLGRAGFRLPSLNPTISSCCSQRSRYFTGVVLRGCAGASSSMNMSLPAVGCLIRAGLAT